MCAYVWRWRATPSSFKKEQWNRWMYEERRRTAHAERNHTCRLIIMQGNNGRSGWDWSSLMATLYRQLSSPWSVQPPFLFVVSFPFFPLFPGMCLPDDAREQKKRKRAETVHTHRELNIYTSLPLCFAGIFFFFGFSPSLSAIYTLLCAPSKCGRGENLFFWASVRHDGFLLRTFFQ